MIGAFISSSIHLVSIALGLGLVCFGLANPDLLGVLIEGNQVGPGLPAWLLLRLAVPIAVVLLWFAVPALSALRLSRTDRTAPFWSADRASFMAFTFLVPVIVHKHLWYRHPVLYLALTGLAGFVIMRDLSRAGGFLPAGPILPAWMRRHERWMAPSLIGAAIVTYVSLVGLGTILQHRQFGTFAYDFGLRVNYFWNTFHGDFMGCSYFHPNSHYFSMGHLTLTELLVAGPFYWMYPRPETLLAVQAAVAGLGAVPVYLLGRHYLRDRYAGVMLGVVYLLHPAVAAANFYDFHEVAMLPFFGGMVLYYALTGRPLRFLLFLPFFLLIKEDMALLLLTWVPFLVSRRPSRWIALVGAVIAVTWYLVARNVILPRFNYWDFSRNFRDMAPHGGGALEVVRTTVTNPLYVLSTRAEWERLLYIMQVMIPVALLPLFRIRRFYLLLYAGGVTLLATDQPFRQITFQYVYYWFPGMMTATVLTLRDLRNGWRPAGVRIDPRAALVAMAVTGAAVSYQYGYFLDRDGFRGGFILVDVEYTEGDARRLANLRELVTKHIPPGAPLAADDSLCPHVSDRHHITTFRSLDHQVDYILLIEGVYDPRAYGQYIQTGEFELLVREHGFEVHRRKGVEGVSP